MPRRVDERWNRRDDEPRYCVFCKEYISAEDWVDHIHNPERGGPGLTGMFRRLRRRLGL